MEEQIKRNQDRLRELRKERRERLAVLLKSMLWQVGKDESYDSEEHVRKEALEVLKEEIENDKEKGDA